MHVPAESAYSGAVTQSTLRFRRQIDLPPAIVWDALIDPVLLEGWLANATVEAEPGGLYRLDWIEPSGLVPFVGVIDRFDREHTLSATTADARSLRFDLDPEPGGTRGSASAVTVTVGGETDPRFTPAVVAHWESNLEQLEELLRGHPVDWSRWEDDRGHTWAERLQRATNGS